jgi:hypothetical protein
MRYSSRAAACVVVVAPLALASARVRAEDSAPAATGTRVQESSAGTAMGPPAPRSPVRARRRKGAAATNAILPGFETLADGSTRLFVELSQPVPYSTLVGPGTITYVLKGAHADRRNNYNPLVTVDFNTPVTSARLAPHGHDLWLVVELRAAVLPIVTVDAEKDGGTTLRIEFPKGDYVAAANRASPSATGSSSAPAVPSPGEPPGTGH